MRLVVKPENILEAIALQTRKDLQPFVLGMLCMGVIQVLLTHTRPRMDGDELIAIVLKNQPKGELARVVSCYFIKVNKNTTDTQD